MAMEKSDRVCWIEVTVRADGKGCLLSGGCEDADSHMLPMKRVAVNAKDEARMMGQVNALSDGRARYYIEIKMRANCVGWI